MGLRVLLLLLGCLRTTSAVDAPTVLRVRTPTAANLTSLAVLATVPPSNPSSFIVLVLSSSFRTRPLLSPATRTHTTPIPPSSPVALRLLQKPGERTICMWFIVKNEKPVLPRLALSAAGFIDTFYACDTGSTDGTPQVVKDEFGKHGIKGTVVHHDWENFGKCVSAAVCVRAWAVAVWLHACASRGTEAPPRSLGAR